MKYFELCLDENNNLTEFMDETGTRFTVEEIQDDEDHDLHDKLPDIMVDYIPYYETIELPKSYNLRKTYLLIFEDGSIFEECCGCFDPIRITPVFDDIPF